MVKEGNFRTYDIRGDDLDAGDAQQVARAFAARLREARGVHRVVLGYDLRENSTELVEGLQKGFMASGCDVLNIGMVATPVLYTWAARLDAGGVMVTASHLGQEYNGFKLMAGREPLFGADLKALYSRIEDRRFIDGDGGYQETAGVNAAYIDQIAGSFWPAGRRLKIVVDAGNGMGGPYAPEVLRCMGHEVIPRYCDLDSAFPNHPPNPEKAANVRDLQTEVQKARADLGLAFDGDADRVGVVDDQGRHISADLVLAWLVQPALRQHPGASLVADVLSSQVLFDMVRELGGRPIMWQSGYARVRAKMREEGAILGGESSGHMFFADRYWGFDDGIYAAGRIAERLALTDAPLSAQIDALPQMHLTPEYRPFCPEDKKEAVVAAVKREFEGKHPVIDVDGVRVLFAEGWGLLRPSGTEEVLSLRFEAHTETAALDYKAQMVRALRRAYPALELQ